jgi:hypothetical protein
MSHMTTYRVPVNVHKCRDGGKVDRVRTFLIKASDRASLDIELVNWRDHQAECGMTTQEGNRFFLGMIHWGAIEPA